MDFFYRLVTMDSVVGEFFGVVPITILAGLVYVIVRWAWVRKSGEVVNVGKEALRLVFVCYVVGLVNLVLVPQNMWRYAWFYLKNGYKGGDLAPLFSGGFNFVPSLVRVMRGELQLGSWVKVMLVGNAVMLVPMGVLLPLVMKKLKPRHMLCLALLIPLAIEVFQPIIGRSFDIDDIIMNFAGVALGYCVVVIVKAMGRLILRK